MLTNDIVCSCVMNCFSW